MSRVRLRKFGKVHRGKPQLVSPPVMIRYDTMFYSPADRLVQDLDDD